MPKIEPEHTVSKSPALPTLSASSPCLTPSSLPRNSIVNVLGMLVLYFAATMALTLHTKWIMMGRVRVPWLLSAYHLGVSGVGAFLLIGSKRRFTKITWRELVAVNAFAVVCALNIALSNVSLQMISLSLHQIIRSGTPLITLALEWVILGRKQGGGYGWMMIAVLSGIVAGIVLSVLGEERGSDPSSKLKVIPIVITVLGAVVSAFKGVLASVFLQRSRFSPLQLLMLTAPVAACICLTVGLLGAGEGKMVTGVVKDNTLQLLINGSLAFILNWTGFAVNKETSALTITVAGNVKQALTVGLGIILFQTHVEWMGWLGLSMTLLFGLAYGLHHPSSMLAQRVLSFWFGNGIKLNSRDYVPPQGQFKLWFGAGAELDSQISREFAAEIRAQATTFSSPPEQLEEAVALLLLFDQFPRNAFRNTPESFAYDSKALQLAKHLIATGTDRQLNPIVRGFLYLPFEHAESLDEQDEAVKLYSQLAGEVDGDSQLKAQYGQFCSQFLAYAEKHKELIAKFGRFPHRNAVLGRESTAQEVAYLEAGGETFGVGVKK